MPEQLPFDTTQLDLPFPKRGNRVGKGEGLTPAQLQKLLAKIEAQLKQIPEVMQPNVPQPQQAGLPFDSGPQGLMRQAQTGLARQGSQSLQGQAGAAPQGANTARRALSGIIDGEVSGARGLGAAPQQGLLGSAPGGAGPSMVSRAAGIGRGIGRGLKYGALGLGAGVAVDTLGKYGVKKGYTDMDLGDLWQGSQEVFSPDPGTMMAGGQRIGQAFDDASTRNAMRGLQAPESPLKGRLSEIDPDFSQQGPTLSRQAILSGIAPEGSVARQTQRGTPRVRTPKRNLTQTLPGRSLDVAPMSYDDLDGPDEETLQETSRELPNLNGVDFQQLLAQQENPQLGGAKKEGGWKHNLGAIGRAILGGLF